MNYENAFVPAEPSSTVYLVTGFLTIAFYYLVTGKLRAFRLARLQKTATETQPVTTGTYVLTEHDRRFAMTFDRLEAHLRLDTAERPTASTLPERTAETVMN